MYVYIYTYSIIIQNHKNHVDDMETNQRCPSPAASTSLPLLSEVPDTSADLAADPHPSAVLLKPIYIYIQELRIGIPIVYYMLIHISYIEYIYIVDGEWDIQPPDYDYGITGFDQWLIILTPKKTLEKMNEHCELVYVLVDD